LQSHGLAWGSKKLPLCLCGQNLQDDFEGGSHTTTVPEPEAAALVLGPLLDALSHLHGLGIIHRVGAGKGWAGWYGLVWVPASMHACVHA